MPPWNGLDTGSHHFGDIGAVVNAYSKNTHTDLPHHDANIGQRKVEDICLQYQWRILQKLYIGSGNFSGETIVGSGHDTKDDAEDQCQQERKH